LAAQRQSAAGHGYERKQKVTLRFVDSVLLEVTLLSSRTDCVENRKDSIVGYYYEHPMIGYDAGIGNQQGLA
jgi:hypothetical protein